MAHALIPPATLSILDLKPIGSEPGTAPAPTAIRASHAHDSAATPLKP